MHDTFNLRKFAGCMNLITIILTIYFYPQSCYHISATGSNFLCSVFSSLYE